MAQRPAIDDAAREAGVSRASVPAAIDYRPGVTERIRLPKGIRALSVSLRLRVRRLDGVGHGT
jgi:hypothetical protein